MLVSKCFCRECMWQLWKNFKGWRRSKGRTIRKRLGGGGEVQKRYSRKEKLNEKYSCTPINPKKYSCYGLKNVHTRNLITKNNSCCSKIPHPPPPSITFLMVRPVSYSRISHKRPPKCKGLMVAYGRSSLTRVGPQGRNFQVNLGWGGMFILKR